MNYLADLNRRYWAYQRECFADCRRYFERDEASDSRPPVFLKEEAQRNVLSDPNVGNEGEMRLLALIPKKEQHTWFRSMNSSQALAQSVLGNLAISDQLSAMADMKDDEGFSLFGAAALQTNAFSMEHPITYLGEIEPRITKVDAFISGEYRIAIECKFTEPEVGSCSRPRLTESKPNFKTDHCDGTYSVQRKRSSRCSLTEVGIRYWKYVPQLLSWPSEVDLSPCPLRTNYQLVRNVLAAGVRPDGSVMPNEGHAVLLYDARNPAFNLEGDGFIAFEETRKALRQPSMLRRCSWQRIVNHLRGKGVLDWLTKEVALKYGL